MPTLLFAYGTLMPDGPAAAASDGWVADAVRGRLFDLGPYPALVDCEDPGAEWVEGFVRAITADELSERLDPYEGVDEGQYRRVAATTRARGVTCGSTLYARPLPRLARGPLTRWDGRRDGPFKSCGPGLTRSGNDPGGSRRSGIAILFPFIIGDLKFRIRDCRSEIRNPRLPIGHLESQISNRCPMIFRSGTARGRPRLRRPRETITSPSRRRLMANLPASAATRDGDPEPAVPTVGQYLIDRLCAWGSSTSSGSPATTC